MCSQWIGFLFRVTSCACFWGSLGALQRAAVLRVPDREEVAVVAHGSLMDRADMFEDDGKDLEAGAGGGGADVIGTAGIVLSNMGFSTKS